MAALVPGRPCRAPHPSPFKRPCRRRKPANEPAAERVRPGSSAPDGHPRPQEPHSAPRLTDSATPQPSRQKGLGTNQPLAVWTYAPNELSTAATPLARPERACTADHVEDAASASGTMGTKMIVAANIERRFGMAPPGVAAGWGLATQDRQSGGVAGHPALPRKNLGFRSDREPVRMPGPTRGLSCLGQPLRKV